MTIASDYAPDLYAGNDLTYSFAFTFPVLAKSELVVTRIDDAGVETAQVENTNYRVTNWRKPGDTGTVSVGYYSGPTWTNLPIPVGEQIRLSRVVAYTQPTDLVNSQRYLADSVERGLDRLEMQIQQIAHGGGGGSIDGSLYVSKSKVPINVRDYGAIGDGVVDDTVAFLSAIAAIKDEYNTATIGGVSGGRAHLVRPLYVPHGVYKITSTLLIDFKGFIIYGDGEGNTILVMGWTPSVHTDALLSFGTFNASYPTPWTDEARGYSVRDLSLWGGQSSPAIEGSRRGCGILDAGSGTATIRNVRVTGFGTNLLFAYGSDEVSINDCVTEYADYGLVVCDAGEKFSINGLFVFVCQTGEYLQAAHLIRHYNVYYQACLKPVIVEDSTTSTYFGTTVLSSKSASLTWYTCWWEQLPGVGLSLRMFDQCVSLKGTTTGSRIIDSVQFYDCRVLAYWDTVATIPSDSCFLRYERATNVRVRGLYIDGPGIRSFCYAVNMGDLLLLEDLGPDYRWSPATAYGDGYLPMFPSGQDPHIRFIDNIKHIDYTCNGSALASDDIGTHMAERVLYDPTTDNSADNFSRRTKTQLVNGPNGGPMIRHRQYVRGVGWDADDITLDLDTKTIRLSGRAIGLFDGASASPTTANYADGSVLLNYEFAAGLSPAWTYQGGAWVSWFTNPQFTQTAKVSGAAGTNRDFQLATNGALRWAIRGNTTAEGGSNTGSDLYIDSYNDAGSLIGTAMAINRASTGPITFYRDDTIFGSSGGSTAHILTVRGSAGQRRIINFRTGTTTDRWQLGADSDAEAGSDAGSSFSITARTDAGVKIDDVVYILRVAGGLFTINRPLATASSRTVKVSSVVTAAGTTTGAASDHVVVFTGTTTQTYTLPAASNGRQVIIKNRSTGAVTVNRAGSDTIDGGTTFNLTTNQATTLVANGTDWCRVANA